MDAAAHQYLQIARHHRNERDARTYVIELLRDLEPGRSLKWYQNASIPMKSGKLTFDDMVREARLSGSVLRVRARSHADDLEFPGDAFSVASDTPGLSIRVDYTVSSAEAAGPMRAAPVELELVEDILAHRQAACDASSQTDSFVATTRHYRAYVLASASLVEVFLARALVVRERSGAADPRIAEIRSTNRFVDRLEAWVRLLCGDPAVAPFKRGKWWDHHVQLRAERNRLLHAEESLLHYRIENLAWSLNLVREGVGGLLLELRRARGLSPLGFLERLRTAPLVTFCPRDRKLTKKSRANSNATAPYVAPPPRAAVDRTRDTGTDRSA